MLAESRTLTDEYDYLEIHTFGEFSIRRGTLEFNENAGRAKKVLVLIEYLVANRCLVVSQEKLFEAVWDEEEFDNPLNTLKNLVYRARMMLKCLNKEGLETFEFILHEGNTYVWNPNLKCIVDAEQLEEEYKKTQILGLSAEEKMEHYYQIQKLYAGEFLPKSSYCEWVAHRDAYYQSIYNKSSKELMNMLKEKGQYTELENVCEKFILKNAFDESVHCLLLESYAKNGQTKRLMAHYQMMTEQFFREYGIQLSLKTKQLYKELTKSIYNVEMDIYNIQEDLQERIQKKSAFLCDYDVFKSIYRLQARSMMRSGAAIYFAVFTVTDKKNDMLQKTVIQRVMPLLQQILEQNLRIGDVMANYSSVQWIIMLPYTTYEDGLKVCDRISLKFYKGIKNKNVKLNVSLNEITPIME